MPEEKPETKPEEKKEEKKPEPKDNLVTTQHAVTIGGKEIRYTVTAGTMVMKEETADREKESEGEKPKAAFFFVTYTKDEVEDKAKRPLTFSFNGGPGSSSVWLHLGLLGPRRVVMSDEGQMPQPPFKLADNEYSLLDSTDLVFIDPVSTGYSRPVEGQKAKEFHDFKHDVHPHPLAGAPEGNLGEIHSGFAAREIIKSVFIPFICGCFVVTRVPFSRESAS